jgi:hypothetical protein
MLFVLAVTVFLSYQLCLNYLVIYCASAILHILIESGLAISGIRKGNIHLFGKKIPKVADILMRSLLEGPAYCVPAFFVADQFGQDSFLITAFVTLIVIGLVSLYLGLTDKRQIFKLEEGEEPDISRREMTRPGAVMLLALINSICLIAILLIPEGPREHALVYLISYSTFVMLYYLINYNLGVRMIEMYDAEKKEYYRPKPLYQAFGLIYDSAYEMALLISPAYWVTFYFGFFKIC